MERGVLNTAVFPSDRRQRVRGGNHAGMVEGLQGVPGSTAGEEAEDVGSEGRTWEAREHCQFQKGELRSRGPLRVSGGGGPRAKRHLFW